MTVQEQIWDADFVTWGKGQYCQGRKLVGGIGFVMSTNIALIHHLQLLKVQLVPYHLMLLTLSICVILKLSKHNRNLLVQKLFTAVIVFLFYLREECPHFLFVFDIGPIHDGLKYTMVIFQF